MSSLGCLHRGQFRVFGHEGDAAPGGHRLQHVQQKGDCAGREFQRVLLLGITDAQGQGSLLASVAGQKLCGRTRNRGILRRGRKLSVGERGHGQGSFPTELYEIKRNK